MCSEYQALTPVLVHKCLMKPLFPGSNLNESSFSYIVSETQQPVIFFVFSLFSVFLQHESSGTLRNM